MYALSHYQFLRFFLKSTFSIFRNKYFTIQVIRYLVNQLFKYKIKNIFFYFCNKFVISKNRYIKHFAFVCVLIKHYSTRYHPGPTRFHFRLKSLKYRIISYINNMNLRFILNTYNLFILKYFFFHLITVIYFF